MRAKNNIDHIFASKHELGSLISELGGQRETILAVLKNANGLFPSSGVFKFPINFRGNTLWIEGIVQDGIPKLGTMWIPQ